MPDSTFNSTRHLYRLYGLAVESEPRLISAQPWPDGDAAPVVRITFGTADFFEQKAGGLRQDCEDWIRHVVLADGSIYIRVNEVFEAVMTADGRDVVCAPLGDVDERTFEANLTNFAFSTSLTLQGEECLHATVVAVGDRAVGLLGPSGSGKSTLSAFLLARGVTLVTDDMLRVIHTYGKSLRDLVRIRGNTQFGRANFEVIDNGRGIAAADHARIFDLFRRSGTQDQPGEGIGLAHVRALAYRLGGTIDVTSTFGEGSIFRLSLPFSLPDAGTTA